MVWRCSYGVVNCPICRRHEESAATRKTKETRRKTIEAKLVAGVAKPVIKNGKITFTGLTAEDRGTDATDDCIFREIMVNGSALAKAVLARAEAMSGRVASTHQH